MGTNWIPIRGPFRGMVPSAAARAVPPDMAVDSLNVHTRYGSIDKRPGQAFFRTAGALNGPVVYLQSVIVGGTRYLYAYDGAGGHHLLDSTGADAYTFNDIVAPSVTPTAAVAAGGMTLTNISYKYTYYNGTTGAESGGSGTSNAVSPGGQSVNVTVTASADAQVTAIRLYRFDLGVDTDFYLVGQFANATATINDNNGAPSKVASEVLPSPTGNIPIAISAQNRLYIIRGRGGGNGESRVVFGPTFGNFGHGIWQPFGAPTFAALGAGSLPPDLYSYRYTYYNANLDIESGPSPAASVTVPAGPNQVVPVIVAASTDPQVTNIRIYRQRVNTDTTWYLVQTVANTTGTYNDNNASPSMSTLTQVPRVSTLPPSTNIACWHKQRMFYDAGNGTVRYSQVGKPALASAFDSIGPGGSDRLVAMVAIGKVLYVFFRYSIVWVTGNDKSTFAWDYVSGGNAVGPAVGAISRDTVQVDHLGRIYFCSHLGPMRLSPGGLEFLAEGFAASWNALVGSGPSPTMQAAFEPITDSYVVGTPNSGTVYDKQAVLNIQRNSLQIWQISASARGLALHATTADVPRLYIGTSDGNILKFGTTEADQAGNPFSWYWTTGKLDFGTHLPKKVRNVALVLDQTASTEVVTLDYSVDGAAFVSAGSEALNLTPGQKTFTIDAANVRTIQFRINGDKATATRILGLHVDVEQVGRR